MFIKHHHTDIFVLKYKDMSVLTTLRANDRPVPATSVAFSHDGSYLAVGASDGTVCVWDMAVVRLLSALFTFFHF